MPNPLQPAPHIRRRCRARHPGGAAHHPHQPPARLARLQFLRAQPHRNCVRPPVPAESEHVPFAANSTPAASHSRLLEHARNRVNAGPATLTPVAEIPSTRSFAISISAARACRCRVSCRTPRQQSLQRIQSTIQPRLHRRNRRRLNLRDLVQLHLFLKSQQQNFAIGRRQLLQRSLHLSFASPLQKQMQRRFGFLVDDLKTFAFFRIHHRIQALRFPLPPPIDHQVPRDGKQPRFKLELPVVLVPAFQHPDPGLLKKILRPLRDFR